MAKTKVKTRGLTDLNVTNAKIAAGTIDVTSKITGIVPAANLGTGTASSSTYLAGDGSYKALSEYDDNTVQSNIAMLGFKVAINGSLAKYNLVDQAIDEYEDTSGIDASASTNEVRAGSAGAYYYSGAVLPIVTQDADETGTDGDYSWYKWTDTAATGSYSISSAVTHEFLVVAGGGGGGAIRGGGGGAGGLRTSYGSVSGGGTSAESDKDFGVDVTYTITVGAGGAGNVSGGGSGSNGADGSASSITGSDIDDVTTVGGGGGLGNASSGNGRDGGSGGAMTDNQTSETTGQGTAEEGFDGAPFYAGSSGGGGGAAGLGIAGSSGAAGTGGIGLDITITGSSVGYAGGGGGGATSSDTRATASHGGGAGGESGVTPAPSGTANTGGGGGGAYSTSAYDGGAGGSGIVVLRRLTETGSSYNDLTLQSTDTTASTANPDYGELVCLIENSAGTATLNTDIKGYVSEDSGVTFTQGTFVDEGSWGTNKKIIAFHDLDISAQSGSSMCYKITTHNQAVDKVTRVYATSLGWR